MFSNFPPRELRRTMDSKVASSRSCAMLEDIFWRTEGGCIVIQGRATFRRREHTKF